MRIKCSNKILDSLINIIRNVILVLGSSGFAEYYTVQGGYLIFVDTIAIFNIPLGTFRHKILKHVLV